VAPEARALSHIIKPLPGGLPVKPRRSFPLHCFPAALPPMRFVHGQKGMAPVGHRQGLRWFYLSAPASPFLSISS
jgi:hypothetical protein